MTVLSDGSTVALGPRRLRLGASPRPRRPAPDPVRFGGVLGSSAAMRRVFAVLERAATSEATVLIGGETGTGKEALAEALHARSARAAGPFMVIDCASIPHDLLESELFGHERGAFTGAIAARRGVFEAARGGTVFLDEIGELGPELQPKLLRVLERRELKRVGSNEQIQADVRIVAATHRDLRSEVAARRFRSDLYYRLAVIEVALPPLRARLDDLPMLVDHFLASMRAGDTPATRAVRSPSFIAGLAQHTWPGNVRELRNHLERAVALHDLEPRTEEPGLDPIGLDRPLKAARDECVRRFERSYLEALLERHGDNVAAAARAAGVDRVHLYRLLWRHELR